MPRDISFCGHTILDRDLFVVPDAAADDRFYDNPLVRGELGIRFYAGAPLLTPTGEALGTLCVIDRVPRKLTALQEDTLRVLSRHVMAHLELRRQTRELARSERVLHAIFDAEPECVKVVAPGGKLRLMNRAGLAMIQADSFEEVAGKCIYPLVAPADRVKFQALTERVLRGESGTLQFQIIGLKGQARWVETHAAPLRDDQTQVTAVLGVTREITQQKEAEQKIAIQDELLAAAADSLAAYVERGDWNEAMGRLLRCALSQTSSEYGFIGVVVGGTLRVLANEGIVWDKVLNRDFYERALRQYQELGYLEFTSFNNLFGRAITTAQVVIANAPDSDPRSGGRPAGHPPMRSFMGVPIFAGKEVQGLIALANRPGGYSGDDQRRIETLVKHAGGLCTTYRQREAAREIEERYRQSQKMEAFGQLAGGVAHDFNNILAAVLMQVDLSATVENVPPEVRRGLEMVRDCAQRGAHLTRQLLLFSHKQVMQPRDLDLNELVTSLAKMLQRIIEENVRLQLYLHPTPVMTHADAGMLDQLLLNLAVNARDAMPAGGRLQIETAVATVAEEHARNHPQGKPGVFATIKVTDSGCGIAPEILPRIFEPFFTTKEAGKGTGLGLSTVFGIVEQHRGWIAVESKVGQGTSITVYLPSIPLGRAAPAANAVARAPGGSETILLVEDEPAVRRVMRALLEQAGYTVLEAADGNEAVGVWTKHSTEVDLLFTDIVMPGGVSGRELAAKLQAHDDTLKVIFTSGYSSEIAGQRLQLGERENFIQKPASLDVLLQTVRRCLDGRP